MDANSLKQMLLSFEKKINKNQKLRMKHPDEPDKFMESEIDLNTEISNLNAIAASPDLYPILVQTGSVSSILGRSNIFRGSFSENIFPLHLFTSYTSLNPSKLKFLVDS